MFFFNAAPKTSTPWPPVSQMSSKILVLSFKAWRQHLSTLAVCGELGTGWLWEHSCKSTRRQWRLGGAGTCWNKEWRLSRQTCMLPSPKQTNKWKEKAGRPWEWLENVHRAPWTGYDDGLGRGAWKRLIQNLKLTCRWIWPSFYFACVERLLYLKVARSWLCPTTCLLVLGYIAWETEARSEDCSSERETCSLLISGRAWSSKEGLLFWKLSLLAECFPFLHQMPGYILGKFLIFLLIFINGIAFPGLLLLNLL